MNIFYYNIKYYEPLIFLVCKVSNKDESELLESLSYELFQYLFEKNIVNNNTIMIVSIIQDFNESTYNLVIPSSNSDNSLVNKCHEDIQFLNNILVYILQNYDSELHFNYSDNNINVVKEIHNLYGLSQFYHLESKV